MMKKHSIRKMLSVIGMFVLIAAMALNLTGCGSSTTDETASGQAQTREAVTFTFTVTDLEGNETSLSVTSDKASVGEALLEAGLIEGYMGDYGLFILRVNGIASDWDKDQTYWACYVDGEYALSGVDSIPVKENSVYSFVLTKG